jgi:hypothetical protein
MKGKLITTGSAEKMAVAAKGTPEDYFERFGRTAKFN